MPGRLHIRRWGDCGIGLPCGAVGICPVGIGRAPGIDPPIPPLAGIIPLWNPPVLVGIGLPGSAPGMFSIVPMRCGIGLPGAGGIPPIPESEP
jgi:hypothetical protein